jgi:hypothetical protein
MRNDHHKPLLRLLGTGVLIGLAAFLPACDGDDGGGAAAPAGVEQDLAEAVEDVDIPSPDELQAEAEASITDANAEAELQALQAELEQDG